MEDDNLVNSSEGEVSGADSAGGDIVFIADNSNVENDNGGSATIQVDTDSVIPVYSSVDDNLGNPVAYAVEVDGDILNLGAEEQEETNVEISESGYTDNELIFQLNQNLVDTASVNTALVGILIGFFSAVELLKLWLQS